MANKISFRGTVHLYKRTLGDMNRYVPGRIPQILLGALFEALSPYATVWLSARLINELATLRRPKVLWSWVFWTVAVTALLGLIRLLLKRWQNGMQTLHNPMKDRMFMDKFFSMDYADVDDRKTRDLLAQVVQNENWAAWGFNVALTNLRDVLQAVLGILGAVALTVSLFTMEVPEAAGSWAWLNSPATALVILGVMALTIWTCQVFLHRVNEKVALMAEKATFGNRVWTALFHLPRDPHRSLDIRTYNQEWGLKRLSLADTVFSPGGAFDKINRGPDGILAAVGQAMGTVFTGFVYVYTCLKAWAGAFSVGSVTQYVGAATALSENVSLLLGSIDQMKNNTRFLKTAYELLDIPNSMYQGSLTTEKRSDRQYEVEFRDVSFQYPGSDLWALRHVNMKFRVGSRLAIVGENGSGKTTFIKLLCRLYDPQEGEILLNGIDIRKYRYDDYMHIFSVVFQDFQLISQPLGANVAGSAVYDRQRAADALAKAGFSQRLAAMPKGLDTMLYKDLSQDGVEISGGEAQKIAIARALYKDAPFIILDEPTAALDPVAEAEIYSKFNEISGDKTAIYISHRLSSCKFCDEIAVFDGGRIVQQGTHQQLVSEKDGKYYALWHAQAQYYAKEE